MIAEIENIPKEEIEKIGQWLQRQTWFMEANSPSECLAVVLYKLYKIEEKLERIEYNQQTHWVH
jgi:hypothetical protein